ncbi:GNAT family N-acetyltransferase [Stenotrophomonas sp. AB1(2024)]|uniref:GNAT family N-acetyltransferase n=1 Tax=Stenotrophomonas sp. AB1(2024) TaxID=3132215 RepID=UPI0030AFEB86
MAGPGIQVEVVDYPGHRALLHQVRHTVFVDEQRVPAELEIDALDPLSVHVLARDAQGQPIGAGRLTPDGRIGRMAVLASVRSQGVGEQLLLALVDAARQRGWREITLHAQLPARAFYARQGFLPHGALFEEAGIAHQHMRRVLDGAVNIDNADEAVAITTALVHRARRQLWIHSRVLDPGLLDAPPVLEALRRLATARHDKQVNLIVHDAAAIAQAGSPLLGLVQRLPTAFRVRQVTDPIDRALASACLLNDAGDYYFRLSGLRSDGEAGLSLPARSRPLQDGLQRVWERSRDCSELRALGL